MVIILLLHITYYLPNVARDVDHGGDRERERELKRREAYILQHASLYGWHGSILIAILL